MRNGGKYGQLFTKMANLSGLADDPHLASVHEKVDLLLLERINTLFYEESFFSTQAQKQKKKEAAISLLSQCIAENNIPAVLLILKGPISHFDLLSTRIDFLYIHRIEIERFCYSLPCPAIVVAYAYNHFEIATLILRHLIRIGVSISEILNKSRDRSYAVLPGIARDVASINLQDLRAQAKLEVSVVQKSEKEIQEEREQKKEKLRQWFKTLVNCMTTEEILEYEADSTGHEGEASFFSQLIISGCYDLFLWLLQTKNLPYQALAGTPEAPTQYLHYAIVNDFNRRVTDYLINLFRPEDLNFRRGFDGYTPLACAAMINNFIFVQKLLAKLSPAQVQSLFRGGNNILQICLNTRYAEYYDKREQICVFSLLLDRYPPGLIREQRNLDRKSAIDSARSFHYQKGSQPHLLILARLYAAGYNLREILRGVLSREEGRIRNARDFSFFTQPKKDMLGEICNFLDNSEQFYYKFFPEIEFSDYQDDMTDAQLLQYVLNKVFSHNLPWRSYSIGFALCKKRMPIALFGISSVKNIEAYINSLMPDCDEKYSFRAVQAKARYTGLLPRCGF